ncbi:MAG: YchJ family protein [Caldilineaceae bacterium]|nr:YchJ family protein [Caldilineaceae bacterium]
MTMQLCPCGSGSAYNTCCEPYLTGRAIPALPEQLMRSRYTAFCRREINYLIATHHPSQREPNDRRTLGESIRETEWLSLRVLQTQQAPAADKGAIEFVAFYRNQGTVGQLHERSEFVREDGRWYYLHGRQLPPLILGRNDPCWCGSGKKVKQCHQ